MTKPTSKIREILRKAERVFRNPSAERELQQEGIRIGEPEEIDRQQLLADLAGASPDVRPSVTVTVFVGADNLPARDAVEDDLSEYVEQNGIGQWMGGGYGSIGDRHFFDVAF